MRCDVSFSDGNVIFSHESIRHSRLHLVEMQRQGMHEVKTVLSGFVLGPHHVSF